MEGLNQQLESFFEVDEMVRNRNDKIDILAQKAIRGPGLLFNLISSEETGRWKCKKADRRLIEWEERIAIKTQEVDWHDIEWMKKQLKGTITIKFSNIRASEHTRHSNASIKDQEVTIRNNKSRTSIWLATSFESAEQVVSENNKRKWKHVHIYPFVFNNWECAAKRSRPTPWTTINVNTKPFRAATINAFPFISMSFELLTLRTCYPFPPH